MTHQFVFDENAKVTLKPTKLTERPEAWGGKTRQGRLDLWAAERARLHQLGTLDEIPEDELDDPPALILATLEMGAHITGFRPR